MGWWKESDDPEIIVGDDNLIFGNQYLEDLAREYEAEFGRKPRLDEFITGLELLLSGDNVGYFSDGENLEVQSIKVKTAPRKKKQPSKIGDYFAVPLIGKQYAFGRIVDFRETPVVIVFDFVSKISNYQSSLENAEVLFCVYLLKNGLEDWKLPIVKSRSLNKQSQNEWKNKVSNEQYYPWERIAWRFEAEKGLITIEDVKQLIEKGKSFFDNQDYKNASSKFGVANQYLKWLKTNSDEADDLNEESMKLLKESMNKMGY